VKGRQGRRLRPPLLLWPGEALPKPGYDFTWTKPGKGGVRNDEIIVYRTCQINPTCLVEFSPDGK
jgi:hypothetical protein